MKIQFNTDKNTNGSEEITAPYISQIKKELTRFSHQITRVEVHLSAEDGHKKGINSKRCLLEARMEGRQPISVTSQANTHGQAVGEALDKLNASLDTIVGKASNH